MRNITMKAIQKASSWERVTLWELSVFTCCFYLCSFKVLLFTSSTARFFLEVTNLNSISFFSRPLGTTSLPSLSFVPATVILWAVKNSFTWHAPTEPGICDGRAFGRKKWKKKLKRRGKNPQSQQCCDSVSRKLHPQVMSPCSTRAREGKPNEAKVWFYREESPGTDTALSQVPWRHTDIAVALFVTSIPANNLYFATMSSKVG